jgi:hypothetical protein
VPFTHGKLNSYSYSTWPADIWDPDTCPIDLIVQKDEAESVKTVSVPSLHSSSIIYYLWASEDVLFMRLAAGFSSIVFGADVGGVGLAMGRALDVRTTFFEPTTDLFFSGFDFEEALFDLFFKVSLVAA